VVVPIAPEEAGALSAETNFPPVLWGRHAIRAL
jgi:hypothetical protein